MSKKFSRKKLVGIAFLALMASKVPAQAQAATVTQNMGVSLTVAAQCVLGAAPALAFGTGSILAANLDAQTNISLQCTTGTPYKISLGPGTGTGATTAQRRMMSGTNTVNYNLFSDAARTVVWGNTATAPVWVTGTGTGAAVSIPVYGRVPQQSASPGAYADTVGITVEY